MGTRLSCVVVLLWVVFVWLEDMFFNPRRHWVPSVLIIPEEE